MKKSKLLQNSKDLLSRSFNPAKCKTSLRLAGSRFKLLRNKKEVQVKQMKREIAQLLESEQDQTARIRVEHVIREEKMMAAYDLLEIYCELVIARLPIIETQKNCPIDLKEAIASLVFAAPRCGDVPELLDVKKQITAKYGKDFSTAAVELRPQCGVGRMLVEKLSAVAPNVETKTKILTTIAKEHNVEWEAKSFGESDTGSLNERLSGPSSIGKISEHHLEPPSQVLLYPTNNVMPYSPPSNFGQQDGRDSEKLVSAQTSGPTTPNKSEASPPGDVPSREYHNMYTLDKSKWKMGFKDATSAAQAAAESAERASMAARAAAELSRQHSSEIHNSDIETSKYVGTPKSNSSDASNERSSSEHDSKLQNVKQPDGVKVKPNDLKTSRTLKEEGARTSPVHIQSFSSSHNASVNKCSPTSSLNEVPNDGSWPVEAENVEEKRTEKRHSIKAFPSRASLSDDEVNIFSKSEYEMSTSTQESSALFFHKYDSDANEDGFGVGPTYDEHEGFEYPSPSFDGRSPETVPTVAHSWSPLADRSSEIATSSLFFTDDTKPGNGSRLDPAGVTFDESDGPISDSGDDKNALHRTIYDYGEPHKQDEWGHSVKSSIKNEDSSLFDIKDLPLSSDEDSKKILQETVLSSEDSPRNSFISADANHPSSKLKDSSRAEPTETDDKSNSDSVEMLNFGKLTGGFRHKGHRNQLAFIKSQLNVSPSDKEPKIVSTPDHNKIFTTQSSHSGSESDTSDEGSSRDKLEAKEVKTKPNLFFSSANSDLDDYVPKESLTRKSYVQSGISRRTKASPSTPKKDSYIKEQLDSDATNGRKSTISNLETPEKTESSKKKSTKWGPPDKVPSAKGSVTKQELEARDTDSSLGKKLKNTYSPKTRKGYEAHKKSSLLTNSSLLGTSTSTQEPKVSPKSSVVEELPGYKSDAQAPVGRESNTLSSNKDEGPKRASHVHPKLPDYDTLFQSLRLNRS